MPHITLECSQNILEQDIRSLLLEIHLFLVDKLPTQLEACSSRVIRHSEYTLGDGSSHNAFVHINIRILPGRSEALLIATAKAILEKATLFFNNSSNALQLKISVGIENVASVYVK